MSVVAAAPVAAAVLAAGTVLVAWRAAALSPSPQSRGSRGDGWLAVLRAWAARHGPAAERRQRHLATAVPAALDAAAEALRAGSSIRDALFEAARAAPQLRAELAPLLADLDAGRPVAPTLDHWAAGSPLPGADLVAAAVEVSLRGGSSTARAIDGVAAALREHQRVAGEVRALAAQARLSAAVLAAAPAAFAVLLAGSDHSVAAFLARSLAGWLCLAIGLGLDVTGWLWMRRICGAVQ